MARRKQKKNTSVRGDSSPDRKRSRSNVKTRYRRGNDNAGGISTYFGIGIIVIILAVIAIGVLNWSAVLRISANIIDDLDGGPTPMQSLGPTAVPTATPQSTPVPEATPTIMPEVTLEPTPTVIPDEQIITISAVGDIMVHQSQLDDAKSADGSSYDFTSHFSQIIPAISKADLAIGNLETTIAGEDKQFSGTPPRFNTPSSLLTALKGVGFDLLTIANEHVFDSEWYGVQKTIENIKNADMEVTGAYESLEDYYLPYMMDVQGLKVAIVSYTYGTEGKESDISQEQLNYGIKYLSESSLKRDIAKSRTDGADIVIVVAHWGNEYDSSPNSSVRSMAQTAMDAGADIVFGSHPHVVQKITYKSFKRSDGTSSMGAVIYSMGNFISSQTGENQDSGIIVNIKIYKNNLTGEVRLDGVEYIPIYVSKDISGSNMTDFTVLPIYDYLNDETLLSSLSSLEQNKLKNAWNYTVKTIGRDVATPVEVPILE